MQLDDDAVLAATQRIFDHGYGVTALSVAYELDAVDDNGRPDAPAVEERLPRSLTPAASGASRYRTSGSVSRRVDWRSTTTSSRVRDGSLSRSSSARFAPLVLLAFAGMLPTLIVTTPARAASSESFTPAILRVMSRPSWFRGTDGEVHLAYELEVTNAFPVAITVTSVDVLDPRGDRPEVTLTGEELAASTSLLTSGGMPTTTLEPATIGVVWLDVPFDSRTRSPPRSNTG